VGGAIGLHFYFTERFYVGAEYKVTGLIGNDFQPTQAGVREGLLATRGTIAETGIGLMLGLGF